MLVKYAELRGTSSATGKQGVQVKNCGRERDVADGETNNYQ